MMFKDLAHVYFRQGYQDGVRWTGKACNPSFTILNEMLAEPEVFCKSLQSQAAYPSQGFISGMIAVTYGVNLLPLE